VRDNGPGIPDELQEQVFRPFFTSKETGTGLGLALTRKVVEAHGGEIELNSVPGDGAEFVITLPKERGPEAPAS
jgi:signal transduction histidine kinase